MSSSCLCLGSAGQIVDPKGTPVSRATVTADQYDRQEGDGYDGQYRQVRSDSASAGPVQRRGGGEGISQAATGERAGGRPGVRLA